MEYASLGRLGGGTVGLGAGALWGPPGALIGLTVGLGIGTVGGAIYGFFAGGFEWSGNGALEGVPSMDLPF